MLFFSGIFLSFLSGILYGVSFVPEYIVQKNNASAPDDGNVPLLCYHKAPLISIAN